MKRYMSDKFVDANVHPLKSGAAAVVQIPVWISLTSALRNLTGSFPVEGKGEYRKMPVQLRIFCARSPRTVWGLSPWFDRVSTVPKEYLYPSPLEPSVRKFWALWTLQSVLNRSLHTPELSLRHKRKVEITCKFQAGWGSLLFPAFVAISLATHLCSKLCFLLVFSSSHSCSGHGWSRSVLVREPGIARSHRASSLSCVMFHVEHSGEEQNFSLRSFWTETSTRTCIVVFVKSSFWDEAQNLQKPRLVDIAVNLCPCVRRTHSFRVGFWGTTARLYHGTCRSWKMSSTTNFVFLRYMPTTIGVLVLQMHYNRSKTLKVTKYFMYGVSLLMLPVAASVPSVRRLCLSLFSSACPQVKFTWFLLIRIYDWFIVVRTIFRLSASTGCAQVCMELQRLCCWMYLQSEKL